MVVRALIKSNTGEGMIQIFPPGTYYVVRCDNQTSSGQMRKSLAIRRHLQRRLTPACKFPSSSVLIRRSDLNISTLHLRSSRHE
jgi:hypothetical protein